MVTLKILAITTTVATPMERLADLGNLSQSLVAPHVHLSTCPGATQPTQTHDGVTAIFLFVAQQVSHNAF